jgi:hypothetical protein
MRRHWQWYWGRCRSWCIELSECSFQCPLPISSFVFPAVDRAILVQTGRHIRTMWVLKTSRSARYPCDDAPVRSQWAACTTQDFGGHELPERFAHVSSGILSVVLVLGAYHGDVRAFDCWGAPISCCPHGGEPLKCSLSLSLSSDRIILRIMASSGFKIRLPHSHNACDHVWPLAPNSIRHRASETESCNDDFASWGTVFGLKALDQCCNEVDILRISFRRESLPSTC